ncbi:SCO family protein [Mesorhizobium sp. M1C.F.Ca.ET.193.01.1.1]|uniref:SCO family protein n=1 Tax=unclassified Mesorhizobium TaxID=325217 RepID=UPI000FD45DB8|nr:MULTISPECIES: SCO family protein [unclassified Mesorhizobium]TGT02731.1 SCO family protein [bacterium M00.F.Ca.ET.177.01.1.1]RWA72486.1 MAG: SCO family protein [Mesorhizobium sp.]RWC01992.1 MAG: SCO family protein [Mesorhizobium sp.]RWG85490.1 MAG: SCO family protein [Mesorhizobium sp.]RWG89169.1 MAG: SCO family protein [Mesorhizobium sp.]
MMRSILVGILVLMAAGIGWLTFDWYRSHYSGEPYGGSFALIDQKRAPITEAAFRGHPSVVFFGFTHCPEVCPTTLFELAGWLKTMGDSGKNLSAYFVTVDPERDTPEIMNSYVSNFSDRITGITGDPDKVHAMAKAFGIYWKKVDTGDGDYTMDHTASVLLLNSKGEFAGTIAYGESADAAIAKLKRLAAGDQT